jgi:hypothetical protein
MEYVVEFVTDVWVDLERRCGQRRERVLLRKDSHRCARVRPRLIEKQAADLCFEDGSTAPGVPLSDFCFTR